MRKYFPLLLAVLFVIQKSHAQTPVAYYPFTGNANDAAGSNNGTVNGATLTTDRFGTANSAYSFDGVDDNISINNSATFNFPNSLTISLWVKYNGPGTAGKSVWSLVSKNFNGNGNEDQFHLWVNATDKSTGGRFGTGPDLVGFGGLPAIDNGLWHHFSVVFDNPNNVINHYLDGALISTAANTANVFNNGSPIKLGYWEAFNNFFNGAIDEVKIYNTALTAAQVQNEYTTSAPVPAIYNSVYGNSVKMNGANDQIELGSTYTQQIFTVEMWVKPGATQVQYADIIDNNHTGTTNWVCQQNASNTNLYGFGINTNGVSAGVEFQLQPNVWQHFALIRDATVVQVYVNGVLIQSNNISGTNIFSGQFLRLGNWGGGGRNWNGTMDEVRYWSTARTQSEIVANMNSQLTGSEAGLVGYWDMNRNGQGAGLTVDNKCVATGAALNGTTVGTASTPIFAPGITQQKPGSGNAIGFDGVDDFVDIPNATNLNFGTSQDFVVETWVKIPANQNFTSSTDNLIIDKWGGFGSGIAYPFSIRFQNNGSPDANKISVFRTNDIGGGAGINSLNAMNDNKWHHIAFAKNGTLLSLYVDGILNGTITDLSTGNTGNSATVTVGKRNGAAQQAYFTGSIDEIRIWNTALTQAQIRDRMCRKITSSDALHSNLIAYYNFDESIGTTAFDATGNNNDGILTNSPTRVISGAAIGNASSHDYVNATKTTSLTHPTGESFTVTSTSGSPDGIQVYRVDEQPNTLSGATGVGSNNKYFGVFQAGGTAPQYTAVYNYSGNPGVTPANENQLRLNKRSDNSVTSWTTMAEIPNEAANTITITGESTEYILGKLGTPLPLNLISFAGSKKSNDVVLQWKTSNETNVSRFEIERSDDGLTFNTVTTIPAGGNSYTTTDAGIFNSKQTVYYRLKSVDKDNKFTYSNIIRLTSMPASKITVFPNPVTDVLTISGLKQNGTLRLFTANGNLVQQQTVTAQSATIDLRNYAKGLYLLQYQFKDEVITQKISKQ